MCWGLLLEEVNLSLAYGLIYASVGKRVIARCFCLCGAGMTVGLGVREWVRTCVDANYARELPSHLRERADGTRLLSLS